MKWGPHSTIQFIVMFKKECPSPQHTFMSHDLLGKQCARVNSFRWGILNFLNKNMHIFLPSAVKIVLHTRHLNKNAFKGLITSHICIGNKVKIATISGSYHTMPYKSKSTNNLKRSRGIEQS